MGKLKRSINIFLVIFLIFEILCVVKFKIVIGNGASMLPTIGSNQLLLCEYTNKYNINDVVLYKINNIPIVHRIVKITEYTLMDGSVVKTYTMKGDNNKEIDLFETYQENIVCKIKGV